MPDQEKETSVVAKTEAIVEAPKPESPARRSAKTLTNIVKEEIVVKRRMGLNMLCYFILLLSSVVFGIFAAIQLNVLFAYLNIPNGVVFLITGGAAVLMWFGKDYMKVEYEYTFTNGVVDIAQVLNNRRRKELISIKTREVELVAPIDDARLFNIEKRQGLKKIKSVLNMDSRIYFACFRKNEQQYLVYFEPSEEFMKCMRLYNERNVIL